MDLFTLVKAELCVKGGVCDDGADQFFQTILYLHFKSSTGDLDAIFNSRQRRA